MDDTNSNASRSRSQRLLDFCSSTTAHGLGRVASAKSWPGRIFWLTIFTAALCASIYHISRSIKQFVDHPTRTEIYVRYEDRLSFPAVTICNANPFKRSQVVNTTTWKNLTSEMEDGRTGLRDRFLVKLLQDNDDDVTRFGHQAEEMIAICQSPGVEKATVCSHKNFSQWIDMVHGNCFTYYSPDATVDKAGYTEGFRVELFFDADEYLGELTDGVGALVTVHSPRIKPYTDEDAIAVAPGSAVSISLHAENITRLPLPYDGEDCENNVHYSEMQCFRDCMAQSLIMTCGCATVTLSQKPFCDSFNKTQVDCLYLFRRTSNSKNCSCPPPCSNVNFRYTVSSSVWPSKKYLPYLLRDLNTTSHKGSKLITDLTSARDNMAKVNINFASLAVTNIKQIPALTIESLFGDIGGELGLFIGASVLTLIEFFDLVWRLIPSKRRTSVSVAK